MKVLFKLQDEKQLNKFRKNQLEPFSKAVNIVIKSVSTRKSRKQNDILVVNKAEGEDIQLAGPSLIRAMHLAGLETAIETDVSILVGMKLVREEGGDASFVANSEEEIDPLAGLTEVQKTKYDAIVGALGHEQALATATA